MPPDASVIAELADDLNFHRAAVALDVIARKANRGTQTRRRLPRGDAGVLGLQPRQPAAGCGAPTPAIEARGRRAPCRAQRQGLRQGRPIRAALLAEGIQLMDGKDRRRANARPNGR